MIFMPILLMNLLIGLAVGDIESVRRNAQLKRLAMQVVLHTELERKLPAVWLDKVDKLELKEYPNDTKCKLGFMDSWLRKWFCNPFTDEGKGTMIFCGTKSEEVDLILTFVKLQLAWTWFWIRTRITSLRRSTSKRGNYERFPFPWSNNINFCD